MQNNKGFTLIETIVSLLLLSIIVIGFFNLYLSLHKYNDFCDKKRLSFQLCQEVLALIAKEEIEAKPGGYNYTSKKLEDLNIDNNSQYDYVEHLKVHFKPLVIEGEKLKNLYILSMAVKWAKHTFDFNTVVKGVD